MINQKQIQNSIFLLINILFFMVAYGQQKAFPTAEGFGQFTTGGRGGLVYKVTNLKDDGEGSLRKGILKDTVRTIVFEVSGTIELNSSLDINHGNLSILGQTAPGEGITIKGYPVKVKADNVIIRYMRFRMGDENGVEDDALGGRELKNTVIDHCSISWATDENASFYWTENFTMQYCIISEALNESVHHKGNHGYGAIWGGVNASFHHNLIVSNNSRNPRFGGSKSVPNSSHEFVDFRNNVIFNWGDNSIYGGEKGKYNIVNNYFKSGPATTSSKTDRIIGPSQPYGKFYIKGNHIVGFPEITKDNWNGGVQGENILEAKKEEEYAIHNNIKTQTALNAYENVLKNSGASLARDVVDQRIVYEVRTGKTTYGNGIIDSQEDVGGWPILRKGKSLTDSDGDGMPDEWERKNELLVTGNDANNFDLDKNYTNLEVYTNQLIHQKDTASKAYDFIVAKDGTGDFDNLTQLINNLPNFRKNETKVYIKNGVYKEKLVLPSSKTHITFVGENKEKTILTYDDYATKLNDFGEEIGTTGSTSFFVLANHFKAKNLTFENSAGPIAQAVAVRVDGDQVIFENCNFLGNQDTLYLHGKESRQYYNNCYIEGTVDFIFGWSVGLFTNCQIHSKSPGYVTAASTSKGAEYGMVFKKCNFTGDTEKNTVYLGRPWRDYAQTVLINCSLGEHIKTEGWHNWNKPEAEKTSFYAEYNSSGQGASNQRVKWAKKVSKNDLEKYTLSKMIGI
ncbi:pectinesterase family protein [Mesonia aestuariivivens]|uniref:Pectin methylesterase n=1 Tax=Mesonia aestuariivivens TaxID=2796128 RepID=A0ABS6W1N5_9FLAO|nr:pectinesterase family protein [Mesonia aestuariivivens]MBW2961767.1 pectin methylesterase [Mesonia aestuariivivens]